jgi:putative two-component system response regulator
MTMLATHSTTVRRARPAVAADCRTPRTIGNPPLPTATSPAAARNTDGIRASRILIVDDEPRCSMVLEKHLRDAGYRQITVIGDPRRVMAAIREEGSDLVLLDIMMPEVSGIEILAALRAQPEYRHLPVLVLTGSNDTSVKHQALELGATDFLHKPVDHWELALRVRNALLVKTYHDQLTRRVETLNEDVRLQTAELAASQEQVILCLARAGEFRDRETANHVIRVGKYVSIIAQELGFDERRIEVLDQASRLHDVGKIGIPDAILFKPDKLEPGEYELVKNHCLYGCEVMKPTAERRQRRTQARHAAPVHGEEVPDSPVLATAAVIALTHHEKWDGSGFPLGLAGEDIPIEGRITAVADAYDAMSTRRPYKPAFPIDECFDRLEAGRGLHFDPCVLDAFYRRRVEVERVTCEWADPQSENGGRTILGDGAGTRRPF